MTSSSSNRVTVSDDINAIYESDDEDDTVCSKYEITARANVVLILICFKTQEALSNNFFHDRVVWLFY